MKSSRLLSILLLLQTRGRMTAAQLAGELEVSVRTVYRDIESLHGAGVPLYGDAGHSGGYRLLAGYRTRLTGLNAGEAEALFLSGIPGPAAELGLGPALATAQLKLRAALPPELRTQADRMRSRFHLDAPGWYAEDDDIPYLPRVADAVWHSRVLDVRYRRWKEPTDVDRRLEPYGLVLKAGRWYLVAGPGPRTYRVDQILELAVRDEEFQPPEDFDLAGYWQRHQANFHAHLYRGEAVVRLSPRAASRLTGTVARALTGTGTVEPDGWIRAVLPIESLDHAHGAFLAMGADVEVLEPPELRARLAETSRALAARYASACRP
ncbi:helix-turn-helix transcriptional regulator [Streptosporangium lutulentum]|uniref:DNA-binding transcriptional regulator YafY n=1 Tax=Streptosporangium lutulentum TaxID=1461250 RepID=A0ABT9QNM7_9ACTN|nr:YafY family protein [Streptosporangium lutulentum]MDP9848370.1 putative DNA-binding transcriptional regulator YafY [Streptosporangium lutulentum]